MVKIPQGDGKFCRVDIRRALAVIRLSALPEGGILFRARWATTNKCIRVIYRHYVKDGDQGWQP